jgi:uncharacterized BrkB/YihY/UPF0761 family membrane protein
MDLPAGRYARPVDADRPSRTAALAARLEAARGRAEALPGGSIIRETMDRERSLGGGLIAGGVAYRLFLWLVPLGLVVAAVLSFWSEHDPEGLESVAREFGVGAAAADSAAEALQSTDRSVGILLATGLGLLVWLSLGAVRALVLAFALAWHLTPPRIRRPLHAVVVLNGLFVLHSLGSAGVAWLYEQAGTPSLLSALTLLALDTAITVWGLWLLPRRATRVRELLPGAALVAGGVQFVQLAVIVYFAPRLGRSEETYGALGVAATMLVWLYVVSRLAIGAAFLNATLWSRAHPAEPADTVG